jgi:RHS repeat-associated protein
MHKDHLGSLDFVTNASGEVITDGSGNPAYYSFDPWGQRRNALDWSEMNFTEIASFDTSITTRGFTGHEMLDQTGLIHMNGRIYDARLARFLQADPFVEAADDTQMFNRYSYVGNNPLNATDPSGYFSLRQWVGVIVAVVGIVICQGAAACGEVGWAIVGAASGAAGAAANGGDFQQIAIAAFSGAIMGGMGASFNTSGWTAARAFTFGVAGGITSVLQGGKFGHGFVSAYVGAAVNTSGVLNGASPQLRLASSMIISGTVSKVTGGKFANGAMTAAFAFAMSSAAQGGGSQGGDGVLEESRTLTYDEYLAEIEAAGVDLSKISAQDKAIIKALMTDKSFQAEAGRIFNEAVASGRESEMLRIYQTGETEYYMTTVKGMPCSNGSSTCMKLPGPIPYKGFKHFFDWHPHPNGTSLPSSTDYITSAKYGGIPGAIWYRRGGSYGTTYYQGECKVAGQC